MQNKFDLSRRQFGILSGAGALAATLGLPAHAFTTEQARDLVGRLVADIQIIIDSGNSEDRMLRDFDQLLVRYADMPIIAQTVMGVDWRRASNSQQEQFIAAFQGYMARKYGRRFREFIGGQIEVNQARAVRSFYEVTSTAYLRGNNPFEVIWLVSDGSGQDRFFNLVIEGVNLRTTERTEIGAMLDRRGGDIDQLIVDLQSLG
jgi:phospholipid transport system substrate-binding protein